jgi:hypothetical protein
LRIPIGVVKEGERNPEHWFLLIGSPGSPVEESIIKSFDADSSGNIYVGGWYRNTSKTSLRKYNSGGTILFSKVFDRVALEEEWFYQNAFNVSSSGNIYTANIRNSSSPYISRRDSSGVEQWRIIYGSGFWGGHCLDSSENRYMIFSGFQSPNAMVLSKLNNSGSVLFQRMLRNNSVIDGNGTESADGIFAGVPPTIDSSGNIIIPAARQRNFLGSGWAEGGLIAKYNSSGTLQWQKLIVSPAGSRIMPVSTATDPSNNIYLLISDPGINGSPSKAIVVKLSPAGDILWQKNLFGPNIYGFDKIHVDSSSNCYVTGASGSAMFFVKYNSSGALQLQRLASITSSNLQTVDSRLPKDSLILLQSTAFPYLGNKRHMLLSLPTDGSVLGSYKMEGQTFTVVAGSFSESNGSLTISDATFLEGSPPSLFGGDPGGRPTSDVVLSDTIVKV